VIRLLKETLPIERAKMRLKISASKSSMEDIKVKIKDLVADFESEKDQSTEENVDITFQIDPSNYRGNEEAVKKHECKLEVVTMAVTKEGESKLE
jgi:ribosome maturation protein SDO1